MWKLLGVGAVALGLMTGCYIDVDGLDSHGNGDWVTESRALSGFTRVENRCGLEVVVLEAPTEEVQVSIDRNLLDQVETWVSGDTLIIDTDGPFSLQATGTVTVRMPRFEGAWVDGSGRLAVDRNLDAGDVSLVARGSGLLSFCGPAHSLTASLTGSGRMTLCTPKALMVERVSLSVSGSGNLAWSGLAREVVASNDSSGKLMLAGSTNYLDARLGGSGDVDADELLAASADLVSEGSGNMLARVDGGGVNVTINASGNVELWGTPSLRTVRVNGSGELVRH